MSFNKATELESAFELNLAPIIDCLTVLITFMLASASFVAIQILDAGFSPESLTTANSATGSPEITLSVSLKSDHSVTISTGGKSPSTNRIAPSHALAAAAGGADWSMDQITSALESIKAKNPASDATVSLTAEDKLEYEQIVRVMDRVRKTFPQVVLGGV